MLDTLNLRGGSTSQSVHVNAVTGAILKNHPKSWFTRFNLTSEYAKTLFAEGGHKAMKKVTIRSDPTDWRGYTRNERDPDRDITSDFLHCVPILSWNILCSSMAGLRK